MTHALGWFALIELLATAALLIAWPLFRHWPDRGLGVSKALGILVLATSAWTIGWAGAPMTAVTSWMIAASMMAWAAIVARGRWPEVRGFIAGSRTWVFVEGLWVSVLGVFLVLRAARPAIDGGEKFMDFALLNAATRAATLPIHDPWLSGFHLNYYHFGFVEWGALARMLATPQGIAYNLAVAFVPAMVAASAFSVALAICGRRSLALASALALVCFGNLAGALQIGQVGHAYDIWAPTRVIPGTINEFPFFTFFWADLHPHLLAMPNLLVFVALVVVLLQRSDNTSSIGTDAWLGASAGIAAATSPWDLGVCALLTAVLLAVMAPRVGIRRVLTGSAAFAIASLSVAAPFLRSLDGGVRMGVSTLHSPLGPFLLVQGTWMLPAMVWLATQVRTLPRAPLALTGMLVAAGLLGGITGSATVALLTLFVFLAWTALVLTRDTALALVAPALTLLLLAELVYVDDVYGPALARMNIVFKFHLEAIVLLAVAAGPCLQSAFRRIRLPVVRGAAGLAVTAAVVLSAVYPAGALLSALASQPHLALDGLGSLERDHPGDWAAIQFLSAHVPGTPVIAEATGAPYSYASRISTNTGLPTILGWANHEIVWRRSVAARAEVARRVDDVRLLYEGTAAQAAGIVQRYGVRYVVVGEFERQTYQAGTFQKFDAMGRKVFEHDGTALFDLDASVTP